MLDQIEKSKAAHRRYQQKRKIEIGELALKAGLSRFDNQKLFELFQKISGGAE